MPLFRIYGQRNRSPHMAGGYSNIELVVKNQIKKRYFKLQIGRSINLSCLKFCVTKHGNWCPLTTLFQLQRQTEDKLTINIDWQRGSHSPIQKTFPGTTWTEREEQRRYSECPVALPRFESRITWMQVCNIISTPVCLVMRLTELYIFPLNWMSLRNEWQ
jgi:hypothetical protein